MRIQTTLLIALTLAFSGAATVHAQEAADESETNRSAPPAILLEGGPSESLSRDGLTVAQLRQLRALERHRQRVARMEAHAWAGYDPLRPAVAANPFMQSHYRVVVPWGYIWPARPFVPVYPAY